MSLFSTIRAIVADDALQVRQHLVAMTSELDGIRVVDEPTGVEQTIEAIRACDAEVVHDIQLNDGSGIRALRHIKEAPEHAGQYADESQQFVLPNNTPGRRCRLSLRQVNRVRKSQRCPR